ncbi:MAG: methyltransferase domain-containing protein [Nitrososphaeria archaeon]|jgi:precorrin-6B methylase 2
MLKLADLKAGEKLCDLGCGDGRFLISAVQGYGVKAVGVEYNHDRAEGAMRRIRELKLESMIQIIEGDAMNVDVSDVDVIVLYLTPTGNEKLKPKFERELRHGTRVLSHDFKFHGWKPLRKGKISEGKYFWSNQHTIWVYKV